HLGYRQARLAAKTALGPIGTGFRGHEFHFATITPPSTTPAAAPLFHCRSADGEDLGPSGECRGSVFGSFIHLIDCTDQP
ncbi:MAG: cobyrinic acid a,c-diamide synthase, partial [Rhodospirillaceae bacterium]